ncbi:MAG: Hsp20/alpha crystallin family protein [Candidatus Bathyarchaeota archaeon]|jgi:HSP20 family molecular chaperone IbpA
MRFEEIVKEMEDLQRRVMESMFQDFGRFEPLKGLSLYGTNHFEDLDRRLQTPQRDHESGMPQGEWRVERIDRPGVKGFIARGYYASPGLLKKPEDIIPPLRPKPGEPRRPLYDISSEEDRLKIYVELPGVEEGQIGLDLADGKLKLEAGDFHAEIDLSQWTINPEKMTSQYQNGILKVTIPKEDATG